MSLLQSLHHTASKTAQKVLNLKSDFSHPVSDDASSDTPDYVDPSLMPQHHDYEHLPHVDYWGPDRPTTTFIDADSSFITASTEGNPPLPEDFTIYNLYANRAERMGDEPLYTYKSGNTWLTKTGNETLEDIRAVAKGLLHYGLKRGDSVAFMCRTCYEWDVFDAAVLSIGGVLATIYDTDSAEQIRDICQNSDARLLVVQTDEMKAKTPKAVEECPKLERVMNFENGALDELKAYGAGVSDADLDKRIASVKRNDLCSIVYTSGSTAAPKGVEITHEQFCATAVNLPPYMPDLLFNKKHRVLLFLPQAHVFARAINYICVASDIHLYIAQGIKTMTADLKVARPHIMIVVPRVLEKVYNAASQKAGTGPKGMVFAASVVAAQKYMHEIGERGHASKFVTARRNAFDPVIYKQIREVLGGHAQWFVTGGAPLDPELMAFFRGAGVPVYEGYGCTETTAPCAFNPLSVPYHEGSVGIPFPGFQVRIGDGNEIQVKGDSVFKRYHKNEEATESSFTEDDWYCTGDLGRLDDDGFLYIIGRKKDLIITAGGKNVSPGPMEEVITRCPIVSQALVLGDKRPFISALITLDPDMLAQWLQSKGLNPDMTMEEACNNAAVRAEVQTWVDKANEGVSRAESVRKFIIVPEEFSQENGLMTASMKIIRPKVLQRYTNLLNTQMYTKRNPAANVDGR
ncbi:AMP-dependent synthetase/ligase [Bifidobacterium gallicum]|uniref:Acyl-CoA synthetase n=1 Tax=Bifidobacterium gallicum DSM 20093 = LMG 11596 TaxID=561180 RepID=D1NSD9_9BIFI|nr:AMP-dependent synthetase/ligase [Bifidobacterium gallicum]EFA23591.1 AMP-binding enzyme [Bifidobacterium gallicum DSM 20093 = LMG 11596]KFI58659.1 AMP-binding protein [Bifidobacterium gallicum DSM 20093 = LMG 11596]